MSFQLPKYLEQYLGQTKNTMPPVNWVNQSDYYANLNWSWINYMQRVIRPCVAYGTATDDNGYNGALSAATGRAMVDGATRLIVGDKLFFEGDDLSTRFLSDVWAPTVNFAELVEKAVKYCLLAGTSTIKLDKDERGKLSLSAYRVDRTIVSTDSCGNINEAVFYVSLLTTQKSEAGEGENVWLVEHRRYIKGVPCISYKVHRLSGISTSPVLPSPYINGCEFRNLPISVRRELEKKGIYETNKILPLPYYDGLGCWLLKRTATNACVPDAPFGDPLLYGLLNLLWSIDVVFSGSMIDVLNGEGKILVPKQFLKDALQAYPNATVTTAELNSYGDENFVYIQPSVFDKDKQSPTPVQFDIRADDYGKMWAMYEKEAAVRCGFSPTSLFPHLTPDGSQKTATEVTAEENLTRASVSAAHKLMLPVFNRALREVLRQEKYNPDCELKLSDYIGNKMQADANIRDNYQAGLIPKEVAVQQINNLTVSETQEYLNKLDADNGGSTAFNDANFYDEDNGVVNENNQQNSARRNPNINTSSVGV